MRAELFAAAQRLGLIDAKGALTPLDSLSLIDLVVELEATFSVRIPTSMMTPDRFESLETLEALLQELKSKS